MNAAFMGVLSPNTTYFYQVGSDAEGWSAVFSFVNAPSARPHIACLYADFGYGNDVSMPTIIADAAAGGFDIVLHAGDVAYDLDSSSSQVGNEFMNAIQPYAASKPYMLATGKCVARRAPPPVVRPGAPGCPPPPPSFLPAPATKPTARRAATSSCSSSRAFRRTRAASLTRRARGRRCGFLLNLDFIHYIFFCTEDVSAPLSAEQMAAQLAWMKADLAAVNRDQTPWVVAVGHK